MPTAARPAHPHLHPNAGAQASSKPKLYNPRHPERTLLYQTVAEHFETGLELASADQFDGQGDHHTPRASSKTLRDRPQLREASQLCPQLIERFANTSNAASLPMALPAPAAVSAGMTTSWPSPARAVVDGVFE